MRTQLQFLIFLGCLILTLAAPTDPKEDSPIIKIETTPDGEIILGNDTSTAEKNLDYLIENNDAVNFALKRGNNKRKNQAQKGETNRDSKPMSLDDQINQRITNYLAKKQEKLSNVSQLETKIKETLDNNLPQAKENVVTSLVEKVPSPTLPPFFSNAYNRVVTLLGNNKTETNMPPKPSEEEILALQTSTTTEKQATTVTSKPLILEDTINEIGSQLIGKLSTKMEEIVTEAVVVSTTEKQVKETSVPLVETTPKTTTTTTTTVRSPMQQFGDRFNGILNRFGIKNQGKQELTYKPNIVFDRYTYSYEIPTTVSTKAPESPTSNVFQNNIIKEETVESINNVQSFLEQFGVTLPNTNVESTTLKENDEEVRIPTTYRTTRRPYPWTTFRQRPSNDNGQTVPADFEEMETTTRKFFPTSFWRKTTTPKPTIRYPTKMPTNKISAELADATALIDTDNKNVTLVKISVVNAGCQSEKSVLMLFNKNQKVLISVDTSDGTETQIAQVEKEQIQVKPSKRPNGVELVIDEEVTQDDGLRIDEEDETAKTTTTKAPEKSTRFPTRVSTTKKPRTTRTPRTPRTTTEKLARRTTRVRPSRRPVGGEIVEYDENEAITTAPNSTKKPSKRRRTKGNKKRRKGVRKGNRKPTVGAIAIDASTEAPVSVSADPESI